MTRKYELPATTMDKIRELFGKNVDIANQFGISRQAVWLWTSGTYSIPVYLAVKMAELSNGKLTKEE